MWSQQQPWVQRRGRCVQTAARLAWQQQAAPLLQQRLGTCPRAASLSACLCCCCQRWCWACCCLQLCSTGWRSGRGGQGAAAVLPVLLPPDMRSCNAGVCWRLLLAAVADAHDAHGAHGSSSQLLAAAMHDCTSHLPAAVPNSCCMQSPLHTHPHAVAPWHHSVCCACAVWCCMVHLWTRPLPGPLAHAATPPAAGPTG